MKKNIDIYAKFPHFLRVFKILKMLSTAEFTGDWVQVSSVMSTGEVIFVQRDSDRVEKGRKVLVECAQ